MHRILTFWFAGWVILAAARAAPAAEFHLDDGDRVVLVGNAFIERGQDHGYLETLLLCRYPGRHVTVRNLGWSGDTVFGTARAGFGTPADGFRRLTEQVQACKPTVIFVGYGMNESFEGVAGLGSFRKGLDTLMETLARTRARIVLVSPIRHEDLGRPLPDPAAHNQDLRRYGDALRQAAARRGDRFVDLFELLGDGTRSSPPHPLTDNGIHLTAYGSWRAAAAIEHGLGLAPAGWRVELGRDGTIAAVRGTRLSRIEPSAAGLRFEAADARLPAPPPPADAPRGATLPGTERVLQVRGLAPGRYVLKVDGRAVAAAGAPEWAAGVPLVRGPELDQVERLRKGIITKDRLYFRRWRPQNETYLFGFRKAEQGQNAKEIPQLDPLIAAQEAAIARLQVPVTHTYELVRDGEGGQ